MAYSSQWPKVANTSRPTRVATDFVKAHTHGNWEQIRERDPVSRERLHQELRERAADPVKARDYLLTTSMIDSLRTVVR